MKKRRFSSLILRTVLTFAVAALGLAAQMPQAAQTDLYFPHLTDGGPTSGQWQTRFTFINPNTSAANVTLSLFSDSGSPLPLNLGQGVSGQISFTIASNATVVLRNVTPSPTPVSGWAMGAATLPIQANVAFRYSQNGTAKVEITAEPTLPSTGYRAVATPQVGVAVANPYSSPLATTVTVYGDSGQTLGQTPLTIAANGHTALNLSQIPGLPTSFTGSVRITPQTPGNLLLAWAVYSDSSGVISSLPDGRGSFPQSQADNIYNAFYRLVSTYQATLPDFGTTPQLIISPENDTNAINAYASNGTSVTINLALAELISDSPSELAFTIARELGHIYQQRTGKFVFYTDPEWDADGWGLLVSLGSGYDPYGAAGALGKLSMATGTANLGVQLWEDSQLATDAHGSFSTRINNLTTLIETACSASPSLQATCSQYKSIVHPNFPSIPSVPLIRVVLPTTLNP